MPVRELYVILNPASDRGRAARAWPELERALRAAGGRWELARTEARGHAVELAERASRAGWPGVLAVGGDGLVHEVANGLLRASGGGDTAPLGVVGQGSGNDFAKMLGLPAHRPVEALRRILAAEPRRVDVGRVRRCVPEEALPGERYFTNGIGVGFDARVAMEAARIRRLRGTAIYALALLRALRHLHAPHVRLVVDGRELAARRLAMVTLANGGCHGGGFWLCPRARIDDGLLDVLTVEEPGLWGSIKVAQRILRRCHVGTSGVELHRGTRVELRSEESLPVHADGEPAPVGVRELEVEVLPARLTVLA